MEKKPFVTREQLEEIKKTYPTPFHLYDEKGIRENGERLMRAFSWNKGFREYFAVKATPNPFVIDILKKLGCGVDCSSLTELMMAKAMKYDGEKIMFSSNDTPPEEFKMAAELGAIIALMILRTLISWRRRSVIFRRRSAAVTIRADCSRSAMISWTTQAMRNTV